MREPTINKYHFFKEKSLEWMLLRTFPIKESISYTIKHIFYKAYMGWKRRADIVP